MLFKGSEERYWSSIGRKFYFNDLLIAEISSTTYIFQPNYRVSYFDKQFRNFEIIGSGFWQPKYICEIDGDIYTVIYFKGLK